FFEGAKYENPQVNVHVEYVNDWGNSNIALPLYDKHMNRQVDVVYPAGDFFGNKIIHEASEDGIYAIGFLEDQAEIDRDTVLTSTVRDVEKAYTLVAKEFNQD